MSHMRDASAYACAIPINGRGVEELAEAMFSAQGSYFMDGMGLGPGVSWERSSRSTKESWREIARQRLGVKPKQS